MIQYWQKASARIDALSLRERVIIFLMAALALVVGMSRLVLDPLEAEQKRMSKRVQDEQVQIVRIRSEIQQKVSERTTDPDAQNRERMRVLQQQAIALQQSLAGIQKGLISPDKMASLLEDMLRRNTTLRLISLKNQTVTNLTESSAPGAAPASTAAPVAGLFRHGVELTVQGGYLDMVAYLAELEKLSSQLIWGDVAFTVDEHPNATMRLTVYTLSLDSQWLHI